MLVYPAFYTNPPKQKGKIWLSVSIARVEYSDERAKLGYTTCMARACMARGITEKMKDYRLVLMPKQGFTLCQIR
jgi:hypothetical protein